MIGEIDGHPPAFAGEVSFQWRGSAPTLVLELLDMAVDGQARPMHMSGLPPGVWVVTEAKIDVTDVWSTRRRATFAMRFVGPLPDVAPHRLMP